MLRYTNAQDYINAIENAKQDIVEAGGYCDDKMIISKLIRGLRGHPQFREFATQYHLLRDIDSKFDELDHVITQLLTYESSNMPEPDLRQYGREFGISFYLAPVLATIGISSPLTQQSINGSLQIYTFVIAIISSLLSNVFGRRRLILTSTSTMLLFMLLVTVFSYLYTSTATPSYGIAVIISLFLFFGGYVIGLTPIPILYVNEIWPAHIRTKGTSVFWVSQAVAVCFNQFVNPIALQEIAWRYYLVYVGVLCAVIAFVWFLVPETKDLSLEEIGRMFDRGRGPEGEEVELADVAGRRSGDLEEVRV